MGGSCSRDTTAADTAAPADAVAVVPLARQNSMRLRKSGDSAAELRSQKGSPLATDADVHTAAAQAVPVSPRSKPGAVADSPQNATLVRQASFGPPVVRQASLQRQQSFGAVKRTGTLTRAKAPLGSEGDQDGFGGTLGPQPPPEQPVLAKAASSPPATNKRRVQVSGKGATTPAAAAAPAAAPAATVAVTAQPAASNPARKSGGGAGQPLTLTSKRKSGGPIAQSPAAATATSASSSTAPALSAASASPSSSAVSPTAVAVGSSTPPPPARKVISLTKANSVSSTTASSSAPAAVAAVAATSPAATAATPSPTLPPKGRASPSGKKKFTITKSSPVVGPTPSPQSSASSSPSMSGVTQQSAPAPAARTVRIAQSSSPAPPPPADPTNRAAVANEKAELQRLLRDMQSRADTWISTMEAKTSEEAVARDAAQLEAHNTAIAANRAAAVAQREADLHRQATLLASEHFAAFQEQTSQDKALANARIDMERKARNLKMEEEKRERRRSEREKEEAERAAMAASTAAASSTAAAAAPTGSSSSLTPSKPLQLILEPPTSSSQEISILSPLAKRGLSNGSASGSANVSANSPPQQDNLTSPSALSTRSIHLSPQTQSRGLTGGGGLSFASPSVSASPRTRGTSDLADSSLDECEISYMAVDTIVHTPVATKSKATTPSAASTPAATSSPAAATSTRLAAPLDPALTQRRVSEIAVKRSEIAVVSDQLGDSHEAAARASLLTRRASETPAGPARDLLLAQAAVASSTAAVLKAEENAARHRDARAKEAHELQAFVAQTQSTQQALTAAHLAKRKSVLEGKRPSRPTTAAADADDDHGAARPLAASPPIAAS